MRATSFYDSLLGTGYLNVVGMRTVATKWKRQNSAASFAKCKMIALLFKLVFTHTPHQISTGPANFAVQQQCDGGIGVKQGREEMRFARGYKYASMRENYTDHDRGVHR